MVSVFPAALAASNSWSSNSEYYKPKSGTITSRFYTETATTTLVFQYNTRDTANIKAQYDAGRAIGMDIKSVPVAGETHVTMMEAAVISTTVPNPKTDIEANHGNIRCNEAEVVSVSQPSPNVEYEMIVTWKDHRAGRPGDSGEWVVNAELSELSKFGTGEWNVWKKNYARCTTLAYGVS